jgi:DNA modification methylase
MQEFYNYPKSILQFGTDDSKNVHPTQKPVELLRYLIRTYTQEGETVLDFTMGSGSTGVAALLENRNFIGIEKDDGYFKIAQKRISDVAGRSEPNPGTQAPTSVERELPLFI